MERLASLDAGFLTLESPRVCTHIGSIMLLGPGSVDVGQLAERIESRLHTLPPFRRRLVEVPLGLGQPYWAEDPDFDIDFHVREAALPAPGDAHQLAELVARTFSRPLDRSRPLWEAYLIQGLEGGHTALLTKIHHAAIDGVSGTELLSALLDEADPDGTPGDWRGERIPSELEMLARGVVDLALQPAKALRAVPAALAGLPRIPGLPGLTGTGDGAPGTPFNGPLTAHRRFAWGSVSLEAVKQVKDAADVTVNDVVVTLCAASARAWLRDHDALPEEPLLAAIPVSVRDDEDDSTGGNRIGMMTTPIATHLDDPLERLEWTAQALDRAKESNGGMPADQLLDATHAVPPALAGLAARATLDMLSRVRPPLNLLISNVPGPPDTLHCLGAEVQGLFPVPPIVDGVGLNITVVSYRDVLGIGITTDREQVEDPWQLLAGFETGLAELQRSLSLRRRPGA